MTLKIDSLCSVLGSDRFKVLNNLIRMFQVK